MAHAQPLAVQSWIDSGFKVISLNSPKEITVLRDQFPNVEFVECWRTMEGLFKAPYVPISAFIDYAKEKALESVMLINSDIVIKDNSGNLTKYFDWSVNGLVIANREDHNGDFAPSVRYQLGFDAFIVHSKFYPVICQSMFSMGQTWWDYWLPYRFIKQGKDVVYVREAIFYHQRHAVQYDHNEWAFMTRYFQWVEGYRERITPQQATSEVYQFIRKNIK
jgi:hypothetical protein